MSSFDIIFVTVVIDVWALFAMITGRLFRLDGIARAALRLQVAWLVAVALVRWSTLGVQSVIALFASTEPSEP